jgi:serine/threonine protein kinase
LLAKGKDEMAILVTGDMGYIDPIYMEQGLLTQKSDVYSFGIVLIELITRRAATYDEKRSYVANFVQAYLDKRVRNFIDNDITSEDDVKLLEMVSRVAVDCLKDDPKERPDMKQVEHQLHIIGQYAQLGQQKNYQEGLSPTPDAAALFKPVE